MSKRIEFDAERFLSDCEEKLRKLGLSAEYEMALKTGLSYQSVCYYFKHRRISNINTIMTMARYLGLTAFSYCVEKKPEIRQRHERTGRPSKIYDWKLFAECVSLICWNDPSKLARQVKGLPRPTASAILKGSGVSQDFFLRICHHLHLPPETFLRSDRRYKREIKPRKARKTRSSPRLRRDAECTTLGCADASLR